ncbi:aminoglycoside phosphotransferase family protein [Sphaerisporangium sp. NBC_01403]|uniref:phosphotransferase family protein n=1 Tax=Sphaerisporangium sp. NBC_01403 TaxID=2903599 RepID=UPI0032521A77
MPSDLFDHPPLGFTAARPSWSDLPSELRDLITTRLGSAVVTADVQGGGFSPGAAARLGLAGGDRAFVKAIPADHVLAGKYQVEAETADRLPSAIPAPRLRWHGTSAGWIVLIFDDIEGRHPDLSPGSADIPTVVPAVSDMVELLTPSPLSGLPQASAGRVRWLHGWRELADSPPSDLGGWEQQHLHELADLETLWGRHADGTTLVHGDIRPDNLLITTSNRTGFVVDWAQPCQGAAWQDLTDLVPHLIMAGNTPGAAEKALVGARAWDLVPSDVITSYAAAYAGYWTRMSRQPAPPGVPNLRNYQRRAAAAAIAWTRYRTGW